MRKSPSRPGFYADGERPLAGHQRLYGHADKAPVAAGWKVFKAHVTRDIVCYQREEDGFVEFSTERYLQLVSADSADG